MYWSYSGVGFCVDKSGRVRPSFTSVSLLCYAFEHERRSLLRPDMASCCRGELTGASHVCSSPAENRPFLVWDVCYAELC